MSITCPLGLHWLVTSCYRWDWGECTEGGSAACWPGQASVTTGCSSTDVPRPGSPLCSLQVPGMLTISFGFGCRKAERWRKGAGSDWYLLSLNTDWMAGFIGLEACLAPAGTGQARRGLSLAASKLLDDLCKMQERQGKGFPSHHTLQCSVVNCQFIKTLLLLSVNIKSIFFFSPDADGLDHFNHQTRSSIIVLVLSFIFHPIDPPYHTVYTKNLSLLAWNVVSNVYFWQTRQPVHQSFA